MNKTLALILGLSLITLFGILSFILPERTSSLSGILTAIVTLACAYIGLQVTNNAVKGKCWNQNMYDSENKNEGGK